MIHLYVHKLIHQLEKKCPGTFSVTLQSPSRARATLSKSFVLSSKTASVQLYRRSTSFFNHLVLVGLKEQDIIACIGHYLFAISSDRCWLLSIVYLLHIRRPLDACLMVVVRSEPPAL